MNIMKKILYVITLTLSFSCKTESGGYKKVEPNTKKEVTSIEVKPDNKTITSDANEDNIKYVIATSGLNFRTAPNGDIIAKFDFGEKVNVVKHTGVFEQIKDEGKTISGEWVGVTSEYHSGIAYVFDGFIADESKLEEISRNMHSNQELSHQDIIGKRFFVYDEEKNMVIDETFTKGHDLEFTKDYIIITAVMENQEVKIESYSYENGMLTYNKTDHRPFKFSYNPSTGILKDYTNSGAVITYVDKEVLFKKGSTITYKYVPQSTFPDEYTIDYTNFRKENIATSDDRVLPLEEWIDDNHVLISSETGDINNDTLKDGIYFFVDEEFKDRDSERVEFKVTTIILLGTKTKDQYKLYHKSTTIAPGYYEKYDTLYSIKWPEPFWVSKFEKGALEMNVRYSGYEGERLYYYFTFKFEEKKLVLSKVSKSFENKEAEFPQKLNLPDFKYTIHEFDVYKFLDLETSGY